MVDFHAEATSEKVAMGWHLDGRVTAVLGTHTHIPTADERVLPGGTAYQTDVGMSGPYDSVIGVEKELVLHKFLTGMPGKFEAAKGNPKMCAALVTCDPHHRARHRHSAHHAGRITLQIRGKGGVFANRPAFGRALNCEEAQAPEDKAIPRRGVDCLPFTTKGAARCRLPLMVPGVGCCAPSPPDPARSSRLINQCAAV